MGPICGWTSVLIWPNKRANHNASHSKSPMAFLWHQIGLTKIVKNKNERLWRSKEKSLKTRVFIVEHETGKKEMQQNKGKIRINWVKIRTENLYSSVTLQFVEYSSNIAARSISELLINIFLMHSISHAKSAEVNTTNRRTSKGWCLNYF